jgi:membrane-bound serine protease (ClpP class)
VLNRLLSVSLTAFFCLSFIAPTFASERVVHSAIRGTINPASADYLEDSIREAELTSAAALIVSLDTPGGLVSSVEKMAQAIDRAKVPVVVYVEPAGAAATSAGALLLISSHVGAMTPGSHMGAAHPVDSSGKTIEGAMGDKVLNSTASFAEGMAEVRGRNKKLVTEIVRTSRSFTASEALAGNLAEISADTLPDLLRKLDGRKVKFRAGGEAVMKTADAEVVVFKMTTGQMLLNLLSNPNIAGILMTLAMILIYVEINNPGVQVAGILGVVCLIIAFMSFQTLPIRTGGIALLLLGALGMVAEIFATTHGALAAGGALSFVLGLFWVIDPNQTGVGIAPAVYVPAGIALGGGAIAIGWFAARSRHDSEAARLAMKGGGPGGLAGYSGVVQSVSHSEGEKSAGKILVRGEIWDFLADEAIRAADTVEVVRVEGLKTYVKLKKDGKNDV